MNRRPRLLFVSPQYLIPADAGGKIRTSNILRGMRGGRFHVTLVSPLPGHDPNVDRAQLNLLCDRFAGWPGAKKRWEGRLGRVLDLFSSLPFNVAGDVSEAGRALVAKELKDADVVVFDYVHSAVLAPAELTTPSVVFTHNVEAEIFERHIEHATNFALRRLWQRQSAKARKFEGNALRRFNLAIAVSERDAQQLRDRYGLERVEPISTAVDLDYFEYREPPDREEGKLNLVFTGSMDWQPNIDGIRFLLRDAWPRICGSLPEATLTIVGRNPPADLVRRAPDIRCNFTGFVDDIRPHIRGADVYVVPLRIGGGTRIKVYEAIASGCPVVSTRLGVEGLPLEPEVHYLPADTANEFAAAVIRLARDTALRRRLAATARSFVEANFGFRKIAATFEKICLSAMGPGGQTVVET